MTYYLAPKLAYYLYKMIHFICNRAVEKVSMQNSSTERHGNM